MIVWLIGLSGAGKTTVGNELVRQWKLHEPQTLLVDGDQIRNLFEFDQRADAHTIEGRKINAQRMTRLCKWLDDQEINAVCSILSIFPQMRKENRTLFSSYLEIYLSVPLAILEQRDTKGLYAGARSGKIENVVGIDIDFPEPENPDMTIESFGSGQSPNDIASQIMSRIALRRGFRE